jgi:hypothetical protein
MADVLPLPPARQIALKRLRGVFRAELTPEGARAYVDGLADLPDEKLIAGIDRAIKECPTFPSVAMLREQCRLAQPVIEATKLLPAPRPTDDESDPTTWVNCHACMDSGWLRRMQRFVGYDYDHEVVWKCGCYDSNPRVRAGSGMGAR